MASRLINIGLFMVVVTMVWVSNMAQSGCTSVLISMAPCLNYVTGTSSTPSSTCCSQLASVVGSQPQCLCAALNGGASSLGITINQTLALSLPGACKAQTPPVSRCNASNAPAMSPAGSPQGLPGGSKTIPATGNSCVGLNISMLLQLVLFVLFMVSCVSTLGYF